MFNAAGIPAEHIDGYMDDEERQILYREHDEGKFKILSCARLAQYWIRCAIGSVHD
jgi:hypothetical protein